MTLREEFEYLKSELAISLADLTVTSSLVLPFDLKIPIEEEKLYFIIGSDSRLALNRTLIILDNSYKKFRLFPSNENADEFVKMQNELLADCKANIMKAFNKQNWLFRELDAEDYGKYVDDLIEKIKEASLPFVETLRTLTQEDIEKEIKAKDNMKKIEENSHHHFNKDNPKGLF